VQPVRKGRVAALVANTYPAFGYIVITLEVHCRLPADGNNKVGMVGGIAELLPVYRHVHGLILPGVALEYQVVHSDYRPDACPGQAYGYFVAEAVIEIDTEAGQIVPDTIAAP